MVARFLIGKRDAILALADAKRGLWLGAAFVLTAALARRYDQADLISKPHLIFTPLLISGANATLLSLYWRLLRNGTGRPAFRTEWRRIVTLFWMTAPLAWLYGIPWERMLDPVGATKLNLWTLLLVSVWRVALTVRFLSVLATISMGRAFCFLMVFADVVALVLIELAPSPMIGIMGGIAASEVDLLIAGATLQVTFLALLTLPLWIILALFALFGKAPEWATVSTGQLSLRHWMSVVVATVVFTVPMIWTQPKQRLATKVNNLLASNQHVEAIDLVSAQQLEDFPIGFDPRPRRWTGQNSPGLWSVIIALDQRPGAPDWVRELWYRKLRMELTPEVRSYSRLDDDDLEAGARALANHPKGAEIMREFLSHQNSGPVYEAFRAALGRKVPKLARP